ncbi:MAG: heavy metal translocating P-type ATPase, partial [Clostridiales Family XIII bacterium]|nr:heavy metal translocating P-type ATPase [Clostridiales Family XIII bacterium]
MDFSQPPATGKEEGKGGRIGRVLPAIGAALFAAGMALAIAGVPAFSGYPRLGLFALAYLLVGGPVLAEAWRGIIKGRALDENFLMVVASIGAFAIGEYPEGVAVMLFYRIGEAFQDRAVDKSKRAIETLMDVRPETAWLATEEGFREVRPEDVTAGSLIRVRPGERVPLDGIVQSGMSSLDTSALTGESLPMDVGPGDEALAGSVNTSGLLTIKVSRLFGESAVARILDLVRNVGAHKAPAENFITKFARYYTPAVVCAAVILAFAAPLALALQMDGSLGAAYAALLPGWVQRALVFLVVSCPCALVISIPLSYFGGIGAASKNGILVKGGNYLEALSRADTVVFDKTGTLTKGRLRAVGVYPEDGVTEEELLSAAAFAEQNSTHPIAKAIMDAARAENAAAEAGESPPCFSRRFPPDQAAQYEEIAGKGVRAASGGCAVLAGKVSLLEEFSVSFADAGAVDTGTVVYVAASSAGWEERGGFGGFASAAAPGGGALRYLGRIVLADEIKSDASAAVAALKRGGISRIAMLSGDAEPAVRQIAGELGIDDFRAGLLPDGKVVALESIEAGLNGSRRGSLVFVGDGINDAPVLARADVGVAMGGIGSDAAVEAADVVLMTDEPSKLALAISIAKRTHGIALQNIVFALSVKGVLLAL